MPILKNIMGRPHFELKPDQETVAQAPDLWYPDGNPNKQKSDTTFYEALELPKIRDGALKKFLPEKRFPRKEKWEKGTDVFAQAGDYYDLIFQDGRFEPALANYRLDIMQCLRENPGARQNFEALFNALVPLIDIKGRRDDDTTRGFLIKGKAYCELIKNYTPFPSGVPEGLEKVNCHIKEVKASRGYKKLEEIVTKTQNDFHLQMTWRCHGFMSELYHGPLAGDEVISAAILPLNENVNEFGEGFGLEYYNRNIRYGETGTIQDIIERAIRLKFKRHFANAQEQINQTAKLLPQMAIYLADLAYMEEQEKKGVHYARPVFLPKEEGKSSFRNVHHPLVTERTTSVGNPIVYNPQNSITLITGPNKGGKTVYVKAVGIAHARPLKGFFSPSEIVECSFRDGIYTHFIKPEDITKGESRFSDEMKRMESIFSQATPYSLVLLDEPCGGTTLSAGETKTQEFLEIFGELGCAVFLTTHMEGLAKKVSEGKIPRTINKHLSFSNMKNSVDGVTSFMNSSDREFGTKSNKINQILCNGEIEYHYTLVDGPADMDYGAQIADSLGLGAENLRQRLRERAQKEGFKLGQ